MFEAVTPVPCMAMVAGEEKLRPVSVTLVMEPGAAEDGDSAVKDGVELTVPLCRVKGAASGSPIKFPPQGRRMDFQSDSISV